MASNYSETLPCNSIMQVPFLTDLLHLFQGKKITLNSENPAYVLQLNPRKRLA